MSWTKKEKALNALKKHRDKIAQTVYTDSVWFVVLADLIEKYIGKNTRLYEMTDNWSSLVTGNDTKSTETGLSIIESAIEFVESNGVKVESSIWKTFDNSDPKVLYPFLISIAVSIFSFGYFCGINEFFLYRKAGSKKDKISAPKEAIRIDTTLDITKHPKQYEKEKGH